MAPELLGVYTEDDSGAAGGGAVTLAVDVYSFGLLLWEIVTGEHPSRAARTLRKPRCSAASTQALDAPAPPLFGDVTGPLSDVVFHCIRSCAPTS
jgi:hypothetical protein